jgi:hypothetical protein
VISNIVPAGIQALSTMRPRGASTRDISLAAAPGSAAKITAKTETMTSVLASSTGSDAASPGRNVTFFCSLAARARAHPAAGRPDRRR